jgi:hypothetical protein
MKRIHMANEDYIISQTRRLLTWLPLLELLFVSNLKLLEVEQERVLIGAGASFFCSPFKICCPFTDIDNSLL